LTLFFYLSGHYLSEKKHFVSRTLGNFHPSDEGASGWNPRSSFIPIEMSKNNQPWTQHVCLAHLLGSWNPDFSRRRLSRNCFYRGRRLP